MGVLSAKSAIRKAEITPKQIDESIFGCARQAGIGQNVARQIAYISGVPFIQTGGGLGLALLIEREN